MLWYGVVCDIWHDTVYGGMRVRYGVVCCGDVLYVTVYGMVWYTKVRSWDGIPR